MPGARTSTAIDLQPAQRWSLLTARELMRTEVVTVEESTPLHEVEQVLSDSRVSGVPVTSGGGRIVGMVTLRDLIDHYAEGPDDRQSPASTETAWDAEQPWHDDADSLDGWEPWPPGGDAGVTAGDIMNPEVISVKASAGICEIARLMATERIHRVVVEEKGIYLGLISTLDVLHAIAA